MSIRSLRSPLVVATVLLALIAGAQPVLADTPLSQTGTVGVHSLRDTASSPGANCKYKYLSAHGYGKLKKIVVMPPRMRAVAGKSAQLVGWTFTVQRRIVSLGPNNPWENRYTSPEMTAVTDDAHNASFSAASVPVIVPFPPDSLDVAAFYRVHVKMFWHTANGSIQGTATHRVDYYRHVMSTGGSKVNQDICPDYWGP